jgi:hypothetical protein
MLWFSCWKSQAFGKYREIVGSRIFAQDFLKSIGWYGLSYGFFWLF